MLQELKRPFDVIDPSAKFETYKLIILPDEIPVDADLADALRGLSSHGGGKLLLTGTSALNADGSFAVDAGIRRAGDPVGSIRPTCAPAATRCAR